MVTQPDAIVREVEGLLQVARGVAHEASNASSTLAGDPIEQLHNVAARGGQVIRRLYGVDSQYFQNWQELLATKEFTRIHSNYYRHVSGMVGILTAVLHEIRAGLLADIRGLLQAEIFADFLEMAEHLLAEGYKDAAAVLLGAVLEDSLRKIATAKSVSLAGANGKPLTMDPLNVSVAKAGVYGALVQKQITSWTNLRNDAAHGHFEKYDEGDVKQMLQFVQKFSADYLP